MHSGVKEIYGFSFLFLGLGLLCVMHFWKSSAEERRTSRYIAFLLIGP